MEATFTLKINKTISFQVEVTFGLYAGSENVSAYIRHEEFNGYLFNGHLNYNKRGIVIYDLPREFSFFENEIRLNVIKILKANKIIKK